MRVVCLYVGKSGPHPRLKEPGRYNNFNKPKQGVITALLDQSIKQ